MKAWTRNNTREWVHDLENKLEDVEYYLERTIEWCEDHEVYDEEVLLACCLMTCVWVADMRRESITFLELAEILGIRDSEQAEDKIYSLGPELENLDHLEMLEAIVKKF